MNMMSANQQIGEILYRLNVGAQIELGLLKDVFISVLTDETVMARDTQLGALLVGIMVKGPTPEEVVTLIKAALSIDSPQQKNIALPQGEVLVGVAGSGKKGVKTMNVSTPACIVAASGGAYVVKPGSCGTSSISGSADFMKGIGLNIDDFELMLKALTKIGIGFFSIENLIPRFDRVYGQKMLGPNPLSFAFPAFLCPIKYDALLYGLSHPNLDLSLDVFSRLGVQNVCVACCTDDNIHFVDELGVFEHNYIGMIKKGVREKAIDLDPADIIDIARYRISEIATAPSMLENIKLAIDTIKGEAHGAREDVVAINAGMILCLAEKVQNIKEGFCLAKELIRSGAAFEKLLQLAELFGSGTKSIEMLASHT